MTTKELGQLMTIISEELEVPLLILTRETILTDIGADNISILLLIMQICEQFDIDMVFDEDLDAEKKGIGEMIDSLNSSEPIYGLVTVGDIIDAVDRYL
jgi:acyl carrier protein